MRLSRLHPRRLFAKPRTPNIIVYGICGSDGKGNLLAQPAGWRPRLPADIEDHLVKSYGSKREYVYQGVELFSDSAMACISYDRVDALSFLDLEVASKYCTEAFDVEMYRSIAAEDAREWPNRIFNHFPRGKITPDRT